MTDQTSKRRRGAPRGNLNALKHGFYSYQSRPSNRVEQKDCSFSSLEDEITVLRTYVRRIVELGKEVGDFPEIDFFYKSTHPRTRHKMRGIAAISYVLLPI